MTSQVAGEHSWKITKMANKLYERYTLDTINLLTQNLHNGADMSLNIDQSIKRALVFFCSTISIGHRKLHVFV